MATEEKDMECKNCLTNTRWMAEADLIRAVLPTFSPLRLVVSEAVYRAIRSIIFETREGLETGVTLFGTRQNESRVALFAVGPGSRAVHTPGFHKPDTDYINREYGRLKETFPGLAW